jgi:hypothetical protein
MVDGGLGAFFESSAAYAAGGTLPWVIEQAVVKERVAMAR